MIKAVIFDMGGVLAKACWDTDLIVKIAEDVLSNFYDLPKNFGETFSEELLKAWERVRKTLREVSFKDVIVSTLQKLGLEIIDEAVDKTFNRLEEGEFCYLRENVENVLRELKSMGIKLGLISNAPGDFPINVLRKNRLDRYMDVMITSHRVGVIKPHPKIFEEALKKLNVSPSEAIYVGDVADIDVRGAKNVGMLAILIREGDPVMRELGFVGIPEDAKPDYIVDDLEEVVEIVKKLNGW